MKKKSIVVLAVAFLLIAICFFMVGKKVIENVYNENLENTLKSAVLLEGVWKCDERVFPISDLEDLDSSDYNYYYWIFDANGKIYSLLNGDVEMGTYSDLSNDDEYNISLSIGKDGIISPCSLDGITLKCDAYGSFSKVE